MVMHNEDGILVWQHHRSLPDLVVGNIFDGFNNQSWLTELPSVPFVKKQGTLLVAMLHWHCPHHTVQFHPGECGYRYMVKRFLRTSAKSLRCIASSNLGSLQKRLQSKIQSKKWQLHRLILAMTRTKISVLLLQILQV
ncbi:unnamed protein product [Sphagnum jensenii]|uniref:Uncharacterized protein n=1 Tax=Sphagnum jensenii TaxID=128206 RepID=A0ABP1ACP6_9BRYO